MNARQLRVPGALLVLLLALTGCVRLPETGRVRSAAVGTQVDLGPSFDLTPGGPRKGAAPTSIVEGYLAAMEATPLNTYVARKFLTTESANAWVPERSTIIYNGHLLRGHRSRVTASLTGVDELDGRGAWLGDPTRGTGLSTRFTLVKQRGQWRISHPPDAMIISRSHFQSEFSQFSLYFFDPSAQILVPESVYLPRGAQAATMLVNGLLDGPPASLRRVERTFIPATTALGDISAPVSNAGVVDVPLSNDVLDLDDEQLNLVFAQLAWTLRQVPGVERMRVTVDGSPIDLPGEPPDVDVEGWSEFDPGITWASQALFGIRNGRVAAVISGRERRVSGPFGSAAVGVRSIAVDLPARHIAAVTSDGRSVLVAPRDAATGTAVATPRTIYSGGRDVLRPSYDFYGNLWIVDDTARGALVSVVHRQQVEPITVPGISGHQVRSFLLSRDGTRLVAVVTDGGVDQLYLARIERTATGVPLQVEAAVRIPLGIAATSITDVAWRTPTAVGILIAPTAASGQVVVVRIDGSSVLGSVAVGTDRLQSAVSWLVSAPLAGTPLYVGGKDGELYTLSVSGRWAGTAVRKGLLAPTFVG